MKRYIVLEGLFDYETLSKNKALSSAVTRWLRGFLAEVDYFFVGHEYSRVWPLGKLLLKSRDSSDGKILGYLNIFIFRKFNLFVRYFFALYSVLKNSSSDDTLVIHSCLDHKNKLTTQIRIAKLFKWLKGVKIICIVGDGIEPEGFDAYFFVAYHTFSLSQQTNKFLFEGVVQNQDFLIEKKSLKKSESKKIRLMYSGAISGHVSLKNLIEALNRLEFKESYELVITGICDDDELIIFFNYQHNVEYLGFLSDQELFDTAKEVDVFINPRRNDFLPNEFNFPSKLLYYMQFNKPIISSVTKGLSPDFLECLIPIEGDSTESFIEALKNFNKLTLKEIKGKMDKLNKIKKNLSKKRVAELLKEF